MSERDENASTNTGVSIMSNIYPYESGDFTIIGPECFTDSEARIIAYKGSNYVRVPDDTTIVRVANTKEADRLAASHAAFERECPPIQPEAQWTTDSSLREAGIQHDGDPHWGG